MVIHTLFLFFLQLNRSSDSHQPSLFLSLLPFSKRRLVRNTLVLAVSERKVHILQALCCGALEQVVNSGIDNDTLSRAVDGETANLDAVLARDVLNER